VPEVIGGPCEKGDPGQPEERNQATSIYYGRIVMKITIITVALLACLAASANATHEREDCPRILYGTVSIGISVEGEYKRVSRSVACLVHGSTVSCS
jgi:hypothetical protein